MTKLICPLCGKSETDTQSKYCDMDGTVLVREKIARRKKWPLMAGALGVLLLALSAFGLFGDLAAINVLVLAQSKETSSTLPPESPTSVDLPRQLLQRCFGAQPKLPPTVGDDAQGVIALGKVLARESVEGFADVMGAPRLSEKNLTDSADALAKTLHASFGSPMAGGSAQLVTEISHKIMAAVGKGKAPAPCCRFEVLPSKESNAFMGPGGRGYVLDGLVNAVRSEDQMAFVLGHEIAHSLLEHPEKPLRTTMAAQQLGRDVLGSDAGGAAAQTAAAIAERVLSTTYSQDQEYEADRLGLCLAYLAGYQRSGGSEFMDTLMRTSRESAPPTSKPGRLAYDLLVSHPPTAERKAYLSSLNPRLGAKPTR